MSVPAASASLSIIVPALNEERHVADAIRNAFRNAIPYFDAVEVIAVNDGSTDRTGEAAEACRAEVSSLRVVHHPRPAGLGGAIRRGVEEARHEWLIYVPGDNEVDTGTLRAVYERRGEADLVIPFVRNQATRGWFRASLSRAFTGLVNLLFGLAVPYYNGHVLYRREQLLALQAWSPSFAYQAEILVQLVRRGATFTTVGYDVRNIPGRKTKAFRLRNVAGTLGTIARLFWRERLRPAPAPTARAAS